MRNLYFVDGLCGSAKTYCALRYAMERAAQGIKFIVVQPTLALINETISDCADIDPNIRVRAIHGGTSQNVVADIVRHSKQTEVGGEILFVTHSAFMLLPYFDRKRDWHVIWDELPQADFCDELDVPHSHKLITDLIASDEDAANLADNRYVPVKPVNQPQIEVMARNNDGDQVWSVFQPFATKLASQHWACYVLLDQYTNLLEGVGHKRRLLAFAHLQPSMFDGFASTTLIGACFKQSVLYHLWIEMDVKFTLHAAIQNRLRYTQHQNGHLLTINYASEEPWSKTFRDKMLTDDPTRTVFDKVVNRIRESVAATNFVWMGNVDVADAIFSGSGFRLPNSPYGLNPYQHIHNAVILSALNPRPGHFAFLDALGLDGNSVRQAGYWQQVYQATMRISLRNHNDVSPKTVTVMDRATAEWLATMFPHSTIRSLQLTGLPTMGQVGRPRQHISDVERTRAHRNKFKNELLMALDLVNKIGVPQESQSILADDMRRKMSEFGLGRDALVSDHVDLSVFGGTIFSSIFDAAPLDFMPRDDIEQFVDVLKLLHARSVPNKQDNGLISPALFDPSLSPETSRGEANVRGVWGIWLDNDGGNLSADDFARCFPKLRVVVFNSYSSTLQKPRWRVFIPTTVVMPIAAYKAIVGQIMRTLNRDGYWSDQQIETNARIESPKKHGFDMTKLIPSSLFYLPSQAADPEGSFLHDYSGAKRAPLDPYAWAGYAANHARPALSLVPNDPASKLTADGQQARFDAIIEKWRREGSKPGVGNREFFELGDALARAGMDRSEIDATLRAEASYANTPADRRRQVKSVMNTLRKRRRA